MNKLLVSTVAAALAVSFAVSAEAAGNKHKVSADVQASCKAQAAKKFSAIHFLKRHNYVNDCVAQHANANARQNRLLLVKRSSQQPLAKPLSSK